MKGRRELARRGFSLVELLVVIAIILLLCALAIPRLLDAQKAAYEAGVVMFLRTLQSDQESYRLATGMYADNFTDLGLNARAPAMEPLAPVQTPRLADLLNPLGALPVYAAPLEQAAPQNPPPPPSDQQFGGQPKKRKIDKQIGGPRGVGAGGSGGGPGGEGEPASGGTSGGGPGKRGGGKRGGSGGTGSGAPAGGGSGSQSGSGAPGTGTGGAAAPLSGPSGGTRMNVVVKHNYIFTLSRPTATSWTCTAAPVRDRIKSKFFFMDQTGVLRVELGKRANASSPQMDSKTR